MADETRSTIHALAAAGILGILGEMLFHDASWGINVLLWLSALGIGALVVAKTTGRYIPRSFFVAGPMLGIFAACFAFREAPELKFANGLAIFLLIGALLVRTRAGSFAESTLGDLTYRAVGAWFKLTSDFATLLFKEFRWSKHPALLERSKAVVRGVVLASPLVVLFGALFASADDGFRKILDQITSFQWLDGAWFFQTATIFCICTVLTAGCLRLIIADQKTPLGPPAPKSPIATLGFTEIAVVFGLLNTLFGMFILVQSRYLIGGLHHTPGLNYSDFARQGFFELVAAAALALGTILGFHSVLRDPARYRRAFALLAGTLTGLVALVLFSALSKMHLYVEIDGLTQLRLYTSAFMAWIALLLVCLACTILRGKPANFAIGGFCAGLVCILVLNIVNPDSQIASVDLSLSNHTPDLAYIESLSLDAAPGIINHMNQLAPKTADTLKFDLHKRWSSEVDADWRGLNYSRWQYLTRFHDRL